MQKLTATIKALADKNRLRILLAVRGRELCVCQIVELLGMAQSTVSKHLSTLHQAGFIASRKEGKWMFYRAADGAMPVEVRKLATVVSRLLASDPDAVADAKRLEHILKMDRDALCKKQSRHRC